MINEDAERYFKDEILIMDKYKTVSLLLYDCLRQSQTYTLEQVDKILAKRMEN